MLNCTILRGTFTLPAVFETDVEFVHIPSRSITSTYVDAGSKQQLYIPSRDRTLDIFSSSHMSSAALRELETLDSAYDGLTQTQKYARLQRLLSTEHRHVINIQGTHCGTAVLTAKYPTHFYGVVSSVGEALLFGDYDFATKLRNSNPGAYWLYRMPLISNGALFWSTEALCSRWYRWMKTFSNDYFKCFNAMELMMFSRRLEISHA